MAAIVILAQRPESAPAFWHVAAPFIVLLLLSILAGLWSHRALRAVTLEASHLRLRTAWGSERVALSDVRVIGRTGRQFLIRGATWPVIELEIRRGESRQIVYFLPRSDPSEGLLRRATQHALAASGSSVPDQPVPTAPNGYVVRFALEPSVEAAKRVRAFAEDVSRVMRDEKWGVVPDLDSPGTQVRVVVGDAGYLGIALNAIKQSLDRHDLTHDVWIDPD
jgi:membrane protein implicated in regulation of membrane protease activity